MRYARKLAAAAALLPACITAFAHDGHGLAGSHWHATDTLGFALVALLAALAIWSARDK
ncbi:MAG TPA: hypothetical protein VKP68_02135 [Ramlibacter sp.]|nr:hypothetical protein [Ramlibacter sp.]